MKESIETSLQTKQKWKLNRKHILEDYNWFIYNWFCFTNYI